MMMMMPFSSSMCCCLFLCCCCVFLRLRSSGFNLMGLFGGGAAAPQGPVCDHQFKRPGWQYKKKVQSKDKKSLVCPAGFEDNGCSQENVTGPAVDLQCRKRVAPGIYRSEKYGGEGGRTTFDSTCGKGHYVADLTIFHGDFDTNAIYAQCYDPTGFVQQPYPLLKEGKDGVIGNYDTAAGPLEWIKKWYSFGTDILGGDTSRKTHPHNSVGGAVTGFSKWEVVAANDSKNKGLVEIKGLKVYANDGRDTGWAGGGDRERENTPGSAAGSPTIYGKKVVNASKGQCPPGKVIVGLAGKFGDRIDSLQFICDAPQT